MDYLRQKVKLLKALQGVSYKEIAEYLELPTNSFYSWMNGQFELSQEREKRLTEIIDTLKEQY